MVELDLGQVAGMVPQGEEKIAHFRPRVMLMEGIPRLQAGLLEGTPLLQVVDPVEVWAEQ